MRSSWALLLLFILGQACSEPYQADDSPVANPPRIRVIESSKDFGVVDCNSMVTEPSFTIENAGVSPLTWSSDISDPIAFSLREPKGGTLAPGERATLLVTTAPVVGDPGTEAAAIVTFASNDPVTPVVETSVRLTRGGPLLELVPRTVAFGDVAENSKISRPVSLTNRGNKPAELTIGPPSKGLTVTAEGSASTMPIQATLQPGQSVSGLVVRFEGGEGVNGMIPITSSTAACGTKILQGIPVTGRMETADRILVQPGMLDFGGIPCGETVPAQDVTIINSSPTAVNFEAGFETREASAFTLDLPTGVGTVSGNSTQVLKVTPKPVSTTAGVGDELHSDALVITFKDIMQSRRVDLRLSPRGVVFAAPTSALDLGAAKVSGPGVTRALSIPNEGNVRGALTFLPDAQAFTIAPPSLEVAPASPALVSVRCKPQAIGGVASTIKLATSSVTCKPLPPPVNVTCSGI